MKLNLNKKLIGDYIKNNNLTITKFCKICKISPTTLKRLINGEDCRINAIFKIARVLNVEISELFNENSAEGFVRSEATV